MVLEWVIFVITVLVIVILISKIVMKLAHEIHVIMMTTMMVC